MHFVLVLLFIVAGISSLLATYKTRKQKEVDDKSNLDRFNRMQSVVNEMEKGYRRDNFQQFFEST